jgi:hypothetical protein
LLALFKMIWSNAFDWFKIELKPNAIELCHHTAGYAKGCVLCQTCVD